MTYGTPPEAKRGHPIATTVLGRTGLLVSCVGAGTGTNGYMRQSNMTRMGATRFEALLRYEYEKGIRFFDLADLYGTHQPFRRAFTNIPRASYVICTKMWLHGAGLPEGARPHAKDTVDRFRRELNTEYIDLVLLHCVEGSDWVEQRSAEMEALSELKEIGVIRAHGVSVHSLEALLACLRTPWVQSVHLRINPFGDHMDHIHPNVVSGMSRRLHSAGVGIVGMKLIGEGLYRNDPVKRDKAIRFVLNLGCVDSMIVGFESPSEVDDFVGRVARLSSVTSSHSQA